MNMKTAVIVMLSITTPFGIAGWIVYSQAKGNLDRCKRHCKILESDNSHLRDTLVKLNWGAHRSPFWIYMPPDTTGISRGALVGYDLGLPRATTITMYPTKRKKTVETRTWEERLGLWTTEFDIPIASYQSKWIVPSDSMSDFMIAMDTATFKSASTLDYHTDTATIHSYLNEEMERITKVEVRDELNVLVYKYHPPGKNKKKDWRWRAVINHTNSALQNAPVAVRSISGAPPIEIVGGHEDVVPRSQ